MPDFEVMYYHLFNAITDALSTQRDGDIMAAENILREAQRHTEELYLD